jgi:hypothetical protein
MPFRPFQYLLTVEEQLACLGAIRRHLPPGGRLVFDLLNPSVHSLARPVDPAETSEEAPFTCPDDRTVVRGTVSSSAISRTKRSRSIIFSRGPASPWTACTLASTVQHVGRSIPES